MSETRPWVLLLVEDDEADVWATRRAFESLSTEIQIGVFRDGETALEGLCRTPSARDAPAPAMILLDLNLPRLHGFDVMARLKANPDLKHIPVVVLTTSASEHDVRRAYELGASSYLVKPSSLDGYREIARRIEEYYLRFATLPG